MQWRVFQPVLSEIWQPVCRILAAAAVNRTRYMHLVTISIGFSPIRETGTWHPFNANASKNTFRGDSFV